MHRLSGLDASFLYLETSSQVLHVCGLVIVDPSTMPGGYSFHKVAGELVTRIKLPGGRAELCGTLHHACVDGVTEASLGLVACRDAVPNLWALADAMPDALAELLAAAG